MKNKSQALWGVAFSSGFLLSACSYQSAKPVISPAVIHQPLAPLVVVEPPKVVRVRPVPLSAPAAVPYRDIVIAPAQLQPVPKPVVSSVPVIRSIPLPVATMPPVPVAPKVKAKGAYHGSVPVDATLRQQYQQ